MDAILHEWGFLDRIGRISYKRIMCVQCSTKFRPVFMFVCFASCLGVSGCESVKFWKKAGAEEIEVRYMSDTKDVLVVDDAEITRRIITAPPPQTILEAISHTNSSKQQGHSSNLRVRLDSEN